VIGTTFGHYRILERLGEGGMGEVFLVEDEKLQRKAALKLISASLTRDETRRQRFLQEARLAASIDHPHIAAVHDIGEADGRTYIAMEYVEGKSLRDLLQPGPLKLRRALDLAIQAGDALARVHQHGVIHRDLKPENLLVTNDGYLKIIDFGLAKLVDPFAQSGLADAATVADRRVRTEDGVILGTMGYMSPEQVRGAAVDARSDVFSFGAVLYEMVTGSPPFKKRSSADTVSAILNEAPALPHTDGGAVAVELQRVLRKCLAKDPDARYQGMRDLVVDLRALREASGSSDSRSAAVMPARPAGRPRTLQIAAAAVLLAAIAAGGWWLWRQRSADSVAGSPQTARPALAVMAFELVSGSPEVAWLAKGLPSLLVTGLAQTPDLEVIGNDRLADAARQIGATLESVDRARSGELARRAGARYVLNGTIVQAGAELRIDARVEDLSTGAVTLASSVRGADALALADDLASRVRSGLNVTVAPAAVRKVADLSSASAVAYRAFTIGAEAQRNNRSADARKMFEEAIRLDPGFGLAYFHLAGVAEYQGEPEEGRRLRQTAMQHIDRMSERDAMLVRSAVAVDDGRLDEASRLLERLVERYPDTEIGWTSLSARQDPADREATLARAVAALPYSPILQNQYGYALLHNEKIEDALKAFHTYVKLRPSEPNALDSLAEGYLVSGDIDNAVDRYMAAMKGGYGGAPDGLAWAMAVGGRYSEWLAFDAMRPSGRTFIVRSFAMSRLGRYGQAVRELDGVRQRSAASGFTAMVRTLDIVRAMYAVERRDCGAARLAPAGPRPPALQRGRLEESAEVAAALLEGVCDVREGRVADARRRLSGAREQADLKLAPNRWWVHALEGEIAMAGKDYAAAARSFAAGEPARKMYFSRSGLGIPVSFLANNLVLRDGRARAAAAQGKLDEAIALYRGLLAAGPQQKWTAMLDPLHVIALARLLDKAGQRDAARAEYQRFLEYWKDADENLAELAEARAALAR
jgi:tetratricopeptide (TPR) repeat protein/predicted Ser/Thr protein kinase